jgi:DNA-binding PadR family transcriptional regulator
MGPGGDERGGRARRGEARFLILDALRDGPRHGYEIIRLLEERSGGQYVPSPGSVYPILQYLEDLHLVVVQQDAERRVYTLTAEGQAELAANNEKIGAFWARFQQRRGSAAAMSEIGCLRDEMGLLMQTLREIAFAALQQDDVAGLRRLRQALADCREAVRQVQADTLAAKSDTRTDPS